MANIITKSPYICAPNIMDTPDYKIKHVKLDMTGTDCIKAGSPINDDGKVANDESAIGILLYDCHACLGARRGVVVIDGRIKQDVAAEHSGITISDEAKAAMVNISFTGDGSRMGGGSGLPAGSKPNQYIVTDGDGNAKWEDKLCWTGIGYREVFNRTVSRLTPYECNPFLVVGKTYKVVFNGEEWNCKCWDNGRTPTLGNPYHGSFGAGVDTGEPFRVEQETWNVTNLYVTWSDDKETSDVVILEEVTIDHKLSGKYVEGMGWSEEGATVTIAPEQSIDVYHPANGDPTSIVMETGVSVGDTLTVIWNGEVFNLKVQTVSDVLAVGNLSCAGMGEDTGEPFLIAFDPDMAVVFAQKDETVSISIAGTKEIIHPIDKKYLPSEPVVFYCEYEATRLTDASGVAISCEVAKAAGYNVIVRYDGWDYVPVAYQFDTGSVFYKLYIDGEPHNCFAGEGFS